MTGLLRAGDEATKEKNHNKPDNNNYYNHNNYHNYSYCFHNDVYNDN